MNSVEYHPTAKQYQEERLSSIEEMEKKGALNSEQANRFRERVEKRASKMSEDLVNLQNRLGQMEQGDRDEFEGESEEGKRILSAIPQGSYVITLEIKGKALSSEGLAEKIESLGIEGKSDISFIIGGSLGMSEEVMARSDFALSFSNMTFPHQMMRVILLEQIYRSYKIIRKETYHK